MLKIILLMTIAVFLINVNIYSKSINSSTFSSVPPMLNQSSTPLVMLLMSVNHELFKKAYSDYSDLNNNSVINNTYADSFDYSGYFSSNWCYVYNFSSHVFEPANIAGGINNHYCNGNQWSGNFLNWSSMTRIDILRHILYGGKRSQDSQNKTVLERASLPEDMHSFVKIYQNSDVNKLTPYNDKISLCNVTKVETEEPKLRIARGVWPRWASLDGPQCRWDVSNAPSANDKKSDLTLRVLACVDNKDVNSERCKFYPSKNYKPIGLLQKYGEAGRIKFGLITGSYEKNISGGVLRRNIGLIAGNMNSDQDEINLKDGTFNYILPGIIHHINQFKIAKYDSNMNLYKDCNRAGISVEDFKGSRGLGANQRCGNWGNPLSEMYLEALRYFSGKSKPTDKFLTNDSSYISGLSSTSWRDPISNNNACANCSIIILSSGLNSFDIDELHTSSDIEGLSGPSAIEIMTDQVGFLEYGSNILDEYLFGGLSNNFQCKGKYLNYLSKAVGLCPEAPKFEGGYHLSGLAYHAYKTDLRKSIKGKQSIKTYAIDLADSFPEFKLRFSHGSMIIQPFCQMSFKTGSGSSFEEEMNDCTLLDVIFESTELDKDGESKEGSILLLWENSLFGNNFDYDASSRIRYCVGLSCMESKYPELNKKDMSENEVNISVSIDDVKSNLNMRFSYIVHGTQKDGINKNFVYKGSSDFKTTSYIGSRKPAKLLNTPLYLAAKYGGFIDLDGDHTPLNKSSDDREWDKFDNVTNQPIPDGIPDSYMKVHHKAILERQLNQIFLNVSEQLNSTAQSTITANSFRGAGAFYQALFQPKMEYQNKSISWGGLLYGLFIDKRGFIREDANGNDFLDNYQIDPIVEISFDTQSNQTMFQRFIVDNQGENKMPIGVLEPISKLNTLWDARDQLANVRNLTTQRNYNKTADHGRYIFSWLDKNRNKKVDANEIVDFVNDSYINNAGILGISSQEAGKLIDYIRGEEKEGWRSRTIDFKRNGKEQVWRLGDIINSTPKLVEAPEDKYDYIYQDLSYKKFYDYYKNRRHVLYVGANDGMLHAFNGGFLNNSKQGFVKSLNANQTPHPLGSEIWSYVPMNLLPHLQWLKEEDYQHIYYVDGEPQFFDVNIFDASNPDYPEGWGTILVVGMKLGGGEMKVNYQGKELTTHPAYIIMDITNPEKPPQLIAEISFPKLGFTVSKPTLVKRRVAEKKQGKNDWSKPAKINDWYLVFGSGPYGEINQALHQGKSQQDIQIFAYDLKNRELIENFKPFKEEIPNSYAGDLHAVDWDKDYQDDMVYFGSIETGASILSGRLFRLKIENIFSLSSISTLLNTNLPMSSAPITMNDYYDRWVFVGSGRLLSLDDRFDTSKNYMFAIKEPMSNYNFLLRTVQLDSLLNSDDIVIKTDGGVKKKIGTSEKAYYYNGKFIQDFNKLEAMIDSISGWKMKLSDVDRLGPGKILFSPKSILTTLFFTEQQVAIEACNSDSLSHLYAVHYKTGTASYMAPFFIEKKKFDSITRNLEKKINLGKGIIGTPNTFYLPDNQVKFLIQGSTNEEIKQKKIFYLPNSYHEQESWQQIFNLPKLD